MMTLPSLYKPSVADHFIGPGRAAARTLDRLIGATTAAGAQPFKVLLLGPPGVGKSALADYVTLRLNCGKWSTHKFNGTQLKIEQVDELARSLQFRDLFGAYRLVRIKEVDKVPVVAQVRLLTLLDDLPDRCGVICTSNCQIADLEDRFQSRFMVLELKGPSSDEINSFLHTNWPAIPVQAIKHISTFACGNVRQALLDAQLALAA
jgi:replication-associated recombination protein RarA